MTGENKSLTSPVTLPVHYHGLSEEEKGEDNGWGMTSARSSRILNLMIIIMDQEGYTKWMTGKSNSLITLYFSLFKSCSVYTYGSTYW